VSHTHTHEPFESHLHGGPLRSGKSNTNTYGNTCGKCYTNRHAGGYADTIRVSWRLCNPNADGNAKTYTGSAASAYPATAPITLL